MRFGYFQLFIIIAFLLWLEFYAFKATKVLIRNKSRRFSNWVKGLYYGQAAAMLGLIGFLSFQQSGTVQFSFLLTVIFMAYSAKLLAIIFIFIDDIRRVVKFYFDRRKARRQRQEASGKRIPRSQFLARTAVVAASLPIVTMSFGIVRGAYDYRIRRRKVYLPNLPRGFEGIRIAQLSDIHSGSFFDKVAVQGGVDLLLNEKPDAVFFTGDLVNNETREVREYFDLFSKVKADLGVYSTLGNHDYGEYRRWPSKEAMQQNLLDMHEAHARLGWDLLLNENRTLKVNGDQISVIGVENWGAGRFSKYGKLDLAHAHSEGDVKLLLSHDPSHWDAQVRPNFKDIDLTLSGHTHGMQLGVEIGDFRWSPSKWVYKQWADLYQEEEQYLYVNRGFGFLGFPGRIGIYPEITILELTAQPQV